MVFRCRGFSHNVLEQGPCGVKNRNPPKAEMKDRDKKKGTETKLKKRILLQDENDMSDEERKESIIVLKMKLCCDSSNKKLNKLLKVKGLEMLSMDVERDLVVVKGAMEVTEFISYIQNKLKKDIEVVNNAAVMFPIKTENGATCIKDELTGRDRKIIKDDGAMVKSTMVFLKIRLHCDHCIQKIRRLILRIKEPAGVERVSISAGENLVVVEGTMNVEKLTPYLKEKIKRSVEIVPIKKENSKEDKEF
ncbi:heavy metal-associated isoprenylated plant protein 6-like isoform X1 [Pistacia vera]|uniref:heavy metal-associated isoprenylated plant protein 6-like isoform X1 n=1 Tax=Pistacia vera TaxID=55513 RepID=UPI001263A674|nr:heavy metal-associated isoprenylated plant protein 6-like isoform X1 [Pistacia vera]